MKDTIQHRLKQLRKSASLTQQQLANVLKTTRSTIASYETGKNVPPAETLDSLANYYDVSVDYLLCRTDIKKYEAITHTSFEKNLSSQQQKLLDIFNKLDTFNQGVVLGKAEMLLELQEKEKIAPQKGA